jgi:hypothetical protein
MAVADEGGREAGDHDEERESWRESIASARTLKGLRRGQ